MNMSDLKTGMWVTLRNGDNYLVLRQCESFCYGYQEMMFVTFGGFISVTNYEEDMRSNIRADYDIIKVQYAGGVSGDTLDPDGPHHKVFWERKETCNHGNTAKGFSYCPHCGEKL